MTSFHLHSVISAEVFFEPSPSARNLTMQLNKVGNCLWRAAAKAAFGSYAEIGHNLFCRYKSTPRAGNPIGTMHESQIQFSAGIDLQSLQWREIGDILSLPRYRHMHPRNRVLDRGDKLVGKVHHELGVLGLHNMLVARAIAQVQT